jgi:ribose transport system substrate-binding protein
MEKKNESPHYSRREAMKLGAAALGFSALVRAFPALADDVIEKAKIVPTGEMVSGAKYKKTSPFRIGFSNGFSGNTWRTECLYTAKKEAARHKDLADFIIVDGQGDIAKQVNDIENLVSQSVDAILCIPNSGSAVAPALRDATKQGIVTVPFNLPVDGEAWTAYTGTDPQKKGFQLGKWLRGAFG